MYGFAKKKLHLYNFGLLLSGKKLKISVGLLQLDT